MGDLEWALFLASYLVVMIVLLGHMLATERFWLTYDRQARHMEKRIASLWAYYEPPPLQDLANLVKECSDES